LRKVKLYIAASLNGKIARPDGSVDWLDSIPNPDKLDYGYSEFYRSIDTTIQGYKTYKQIIDWGIDFPYPDKENFVLTTKQDLEDTEHVQFISEDHIAFIKNLKKQKGKDIWLIGGGTVNTLLLNEGLIDEIRLFIMPVIISAGIDLFEFIPNETHLKRNNVKSYPTGVVEIVYQSM
jgi:dihydrofolate reductase